MSASAQPRVELAVETPFARAARLSELRGQVVAIFYESRDQMDESDTLKAELSALATNNSDLKVLGLADLAAFDFAPARPVVRTFIRALCARNPGVEVWIDWKGALRQALGLPGGNHLVLLDREGRVVLRTRTPADELSRARVRAQAQRLLAGPSAMGGSAA